MNLSVSNFWIRALFEIFRVINCSIKFVVAPISTHEDALNMQGILMNSKQFGNLRKHFVITPHEMHLAKKSICLILFL